MKEKKEQLKKITKELGVTRTMALLPFSFYILLFLVSRKNNLSPTMYVDRSIRQTDTTFLDS